MKDLLDSCKWEHDRPALVFCGVVTVCNLTTRRSRYFVFNCVIDLIAENAFMHQTNIVKPIDL